MILKHGLLKIIKQLFIPDAATVDSPFIAATGIVIVIVLVCIETLSAVSKQHKQFQYFYLIFLTLFLYEFPKISPDDYT